MSENGKRLLSFLMVVAMVFSMMPLRAGAQEQEEEQVTIETLQPETTLPEATLPQVIVPEETQPEVAEPEQPAERPATRQETNEEYPALEFGVPMDVVLPEPQATWLTFTPTESGIYSFTFMSEENVGAHIYDYNQEYLQNNYGQNGLYMFQQMEGGKTYYLTVDLASGNSGTITVTVGYSPLESITFEPVSFVEGTCGHIAFGWNEQTQQNDLPFYYYPLWLSYTATFTDGTVVTGRESRIHYNGIEYGLDYYAEQSYEKQWVAGNTYTVKVRALGHEVEIPVTIVDAAVQSITIDPIKVVAGTYGYMNTAWNPETGNYDLEYFYYSASDIMQKAEYAVTYDSGYVEYGSGEMVYYEGEWFSFATYANQDYENQWTVGNTYYIDAFLFGQQVQVPVTIIDTPLQSIEFQPITVMEGTCGGISTSWNPETEKSDLAYYQYYAWDLFYKTSYTATFIDGTVMTGSNDSFYYDGTWYSMSCYTDQSYNNQWTAGNTHALKVEIMGQEVEVPVTITPSPLQSIEFQPITIMEGTYGSISTGWNPETGNYDLEYYYYQEWDVLGKTQYTATFADGTTQTNYGNNSLSYEDQWYSLSCHAVQNYENRWTAGNTYYIAVAALGKVVQVPVTIVESPAVSITAEPVIVYEGKGGSWNSYWPGNGEELLYYAYNWYTKVNYTVTFKDGTTVTASKGSGIDYNGEYYSMGCSDDQSYENQWTLGNTYTATISCMGVSTEVSVTVEQAPIIRLELDMPADVTISEDEEYAELLFTPEESGTYIFTSISDIDTYGELYEVLENGTNQIAYNDDSGDGMNFLVTANLVAGQTYSLHARSYSRSACTFQVTVKQSPLESVAFDPILLEEYADGSWSWGENGEYYRYDWSNKLAYTVTFRDGTTKRGTYWSGVEYDGVHYGINGTSDTQSENPWLIGNTYTVKINFAGTWYEAYLSVSKKTEDNGFTYIAQGGKAVINGCTLQTEILQIPEIIDGYQVVGITSLGDALAYAEEVRIPDSVTMLSAELFNPYGPFAIPLKKLVLGAGITSLDAPMLCNARQLEQIVVAAGNPALCSIDGVAYNKNLTALVVYPAAKQELHKMPDSVTDVSALMDEDRTYYYGNINVQFGAGVKDYKMVGGIIYNADMTRVIKATGSAVGSYVMPDTVTGIALHAFTGSKLTSIEVSPSVTYLSYASFYEAIDLEEISVPKSVTAISGYFSTCENLKKVHIADVGAWCNVEGGGGLLYRAHDLYLNGEKIVDLVIPETVTEGVYNTSSIAFEAFAYGSFESVTVPSRIDYIHWNAFYGCEDLKKVNISDLSDWCSIQFDNAQANPLYYARNLYLNGEKVTDLVLPETVTGNVYVGDLVYGVGDFTFYNINIDKLTVPSYVYQIGQEAFYGSSVEEIVLEEGVSSIGSSAFQNSGLKALELPDSLSNMEYNAFASCKDLEQVTFGSGLVMIPERAFCNTGLKSVTLPKQIQYVGSSAFENAKLTEVNLLCDEVQIGWSAFKNCPLGDLKLGDNITYMDWEAFNGISATQIQHPASVTEISYRVYALNPNLVSVTIPETVQYIDTFAFEGDSNLSHVLYTGTQEQWEKLDTYSNELNKATIHYEATGNEVTTEQNCTTIRLFCTICDQWETVQKKNTSHSFENGVCTVCGYEGFWAYEVEGSAVTITGYLGNDPDVTIPEEIDGLPVTAFTADTFSYNRKITSVVLPDGITQIPEGAFRSCTALRSVTLGEKVTAIGSEAFLEALSLETINLPDSLTDIGDAAFYRCFDLDVTIPKSVRTIGAMAFYSCQSLEKVEIPTGVTQIAYQAFSACWNLDEVVLPDTVTAIGYYAFSGCGDLEELELPKNLTTIDGSAFYYTGIKEMTIPASVQQIGMDAFFSEDLDTLIFQGDMPQMENAFKQNGLTVFYAASNKTWRELPSDNNRWYACKAPIITTQPANQTVQPGETVTLSAEAYGQRLSYQWYYAAPNSKTFTPVGGDRIELTLTVDQDTSGARAYCVVTDLLGQTAKTDTVTLKNPTRATGIRLNQLPYTLEYDLRQELRTRGLEVVLTFDDNTQEQVLDYTVSGYNPNVGGVQTVTITYGGYTATFQVTVNEEKLNFANAEQKVELSAPEGAVEHDVELVVETVEPEQALPELPEIPEVLQENEAVIFDITLEKGGEEVQPTETVQVSIPVPEHMESKRCKVYHIGDDGAATDMNATYRDGRMVFDTDHFSYYAVVETPGVTVSGAIIGGNVTGTVVRLLSGGEVLESVSVSQNGTYLFENVVSNDYVIEVVQEGMSTVSETITVADEDVRKDIVCYYVAVEANGQQTQYSTLAQAVENAPAGSTVQLLGSFAEDVTVTKELVLDLNGFELSGDIVATGVKLFVKDSQTDDYTVMDEAGYGKLTGTVTGVQAADGYMMIAEGSGVSFHRIDLTLTDMTLRPSKAGVYYKSNFAGDEIVARNVARYGVALSVQGEPTENAPSILSWFEGFQAGSNAANGTLLHGIMKLTNSETDNGEYAQMPVYGSAYILTNDGRYIFGESVSRSLRQQVELIDSRWSTLTAEQKTGVLEMYESYQSVMENWNISNIKSNSAK